MARAEAGDLDLVSWMVKLRCQCARRARAHPGLRFFLFHAVPAGLDCKPRHKTAGAAGGCMLIRRSALERIGGITAIRGELIDDCAWPAP